MLLSFVAAAFRFYTEASSGKTKRENKCKNQLDNERMKALHVKLTNMETSKAWETYNILHNYRSFKE